MDYLLEPAEVLDEDAGLEVWCLDVSGSMCVSEEVRASQREWKSMREERMGTENSRVKNKPQELLVDGETIGGQVFRVPFLLSSTWLAKAVTQCTFPAWSAFS